MNIGLLVLRVVAGGLFAGHGAQKLFGWFGGAGIEATGRGFEQLGMRPGRQQAIAAGTCEFASGILIAVGFLTPFAAAMLIAVMTVAIITVHVSKGVWVTEGGYEYNLVLMAIAFALAGIGAGKVSLDRAFDLAVAGPGWALFALAAGVGGGLGAVYVARHREGRVSTSASLGR